MHSGKFACRPATQPFSYYLFLISFGQPASVTDQSADGVVTSHISNFLMKREYAPLFVLENIRKHHNLFEVFLKLLYNLTAFRSRFNIICLQKAIRLALECHRFKVS